jgi:hypothetical protein
VNFGNFLVVAGRASSLEDRVPFLRLEEAGAECSLLDGSDVAIVAALTRMVVHLLLLAARDSAHITG